MENMRYVGNGAFEIDLRSFSLFNVTPAKVRDISQKHRITSGPGFDQRYMPSMNELSNIGEMIETAVNSGQLIDFGYWPNDMIKQNSKRSALMYIQGALMHPFSSPYIIMHSWDDKNHPMADRLEKAGPMTCAYLVNPFPGDGTCIDFEAIELDGVKVIHQECLGVSDRIIYHAEEAMKHNIPCCNVIPFALRFPQIRNDPEFQTLLGHGRTVIESAMANVLDPVMTALAILATRGVPSEIVKPSDKLAKARSKAGKPPIPPYRQVDSRLYVTALLARQERRKGTPQGGTHASPIPHIRIGHWRHYKTGEKSAIQDTLVNATDDMRQLFKSNRSHYVVKPD